jgi:hypothetical protein
MEKDSSISLLDKIVEVTNSLQPDSLNEIREKLILLINELINKDFQALLQLLYRIDVNEKKIRLYLNEKTNEDSSNVLADMIIERQLQKIETRKKFKLKNKRKNDEEKW